VPFRLPFRLTPRSAAELGVATVLGLVGLILLLGTADEYKARKAFNRAMDGYAAGNMQAVAENIEAAKYAKPEYDAPREAEGKLLVDEGQSNPAKFADALRVYEQLRQHQESTGRKPTLPVLVGLAVAELEATRAAAPRPDVLAAVLAKARASLEAALTTHEDSGDVHVNLATIAFIQGDLARCKAEIDKVAAAGNIGPDSLSVLYNLNGLVALKERRFADAALEFAKVKEFKPDWDVPQLNLAAAHAQILAAHGSDPRQADTAARELRSMVAVLRRTRSPLYALICQAFASYHTAQKGGAPEAIAFFTEAERLAKLSWQSRFNQAIAVYLNARAGRVRNPHLFAVPAAELTAALDNPKASTRDKFLASCILGTIEGETGKSKAPAIAHFEHAAALAAGPSDPFFRAAMLRVHVSLAVLYYETEQFAKMADHLAKVKGLLDKAEQSRLDVLGAQVGSNPTISQFEAKLEKLFTDYDLLVTANLAVPGSVKPLGPDSVTLNLLETASGTSRPLHFQLNGPSLCAAAVNLPQGRYRVELSLINPVGKKGTATSEVFELDRDPPRVLNRRPDAGASVPSLKAIEFELKDSLSSVNIESVRVMVRYPPGGSVASRTLVSAGKVQFASTDPPIARLSPISPNVRAPMPPDKLPKGEYLVNVHAEDAKGNSRNIEWSFTLAP